MILRRFAALAGFVSTILLAAASTRADTFSDVFFEELRRRDQREEDRERREPVPDVRLQSEAPPVDIEALPREEPCFTILTVRLDGDTNGDFPWLPAITDRYLGQCIGVEGINLIVKRLQRELLVRGFITTRIYIPKQDLTSATLALTLVPGVIHDIRFANDGRGSWRTAFPSSPGDLLNLRDLEQGLEQLKRMPTQDVEMDMVPGTKPGETDIVIRRRAEAPWRAFLSVDNSGARSTGDWQGAATLAWDDVFGINDLFHLSLNTNTNRSDSSRGTRGNSVYYSFPSGYWTFALAASEYKYHQTVQGTSQSFVSSGETRQIDVRAQHGIHRTARSKTAGQFRLIKKKSANFIDDTEIEVQRRDVTAAELALSHRQYIGRSVLDLFVAHRQGVSWLGAQDDPGSGAGAPTTRYRVQTWDINFTAPFAVADVASRYIAALRAQTTSDMLFGSDLFAIGNRYTVRGFDGEQTLASERGVYMRNEIGVALGNSGQEAYAGLDYGRVSGPSAAVLAGRSLAGAVLGLRGAYKRNFQYDIAAGWPLQRPESFPARQPVYDVLLTYQF